MPRQTILICEADSAAGSFENLSSPDYLMVALEQFPPSEKIFGPFGLSPILRVRSPANGRPSQIKIESLDRGVHPLAPANVAIDRRLREIDGSQLGQELHRSRLQEHEGIRPLKLDLRKSF
jgi:hypothetical protein